MALTVTIDQNSAMGFRSFPIKSGVSVLPGDLCGLDSNGQINLAIATTPIQALGFAGPPDVGEGPNARVGVAALTVKQTLYSRGVVQGGQGMSGLTIGGQVYLSATAAQWTQTKPGAGDIIQMVGIAIAADTVAVNITPTGIVQQAAATSTATLL